MVILVLDGYPKDDYKGYENWLEYPLQFFPEAGLMTYSEAEEYCQIRGGQMPNWFHSSFAGYKAAYEEGTYLPINFFQPIDLNQISRVV